MEKKIFDTPIKNKEKHEKIIEIGKRMTTKQVIYWTMDILQSITI